MAPRLSKRQQREQEELEALGGSAKHQTGSEHGGSSEDEPAPMSSAAPSKAIHGFAALVDDDQDQERDDASEDDEPKLAPKSKKSKKKKRKGPVSSEYDPPPPRPKDTKGKKSKDDPKSKGKKRAHEDDFDKALAELSEKHLNVQSSGSTPTSGSLALFDAFNSLLSVSPKNLDPETELRRFFGSKVISSSSPTHKPTRTQTARSHLARPQQNWPPPHYRAGLSMRALTSDEVHAIGTGVGPDNRERWWTIEASPRYKGTTYEFIQCVMGGDPQLFFNLLREMPWHADTLLQTAEVFRHREEYSATADFLSRVLFAYERGFAATFNLTTGIHRLDFDHVESRVFYLALSRNVVDLNRRGTPRTAFEFARLLLALDPYTDPHGALLHLDYLAIKAGQTSWLLDMWNTYEGLHALEKEGEETRFDVTSMPGWHWARALALFDRQTDQGNGTSKQALLNAILAFPSVLPLLADKADISMPAELRKLDVFKIVTDYSPYRDDLSTSLIHLLSHIYALRSASLWKQPPRAGWLSASLNSLAADLPAALYGPAPRARTRLLTLFSQQSNVTDAVYRHVAVVAPLVPDFRRLTAFFPLEVKERLPQTIEGDPLPPVTAVSVYGDAYFAAVGTDERGRAAERLAAELRRAFPNGADRRQFQALFDGHPEIEAGFAGGVDELAQIVRRFPQEVLDALLVMVGDGGNQLVDVDQGRMPGGGAILAEHQDPAPEVDDRVAAEDEEDNAEEEDERPILPVRIVQTLLGRLWGRGAQVDSDSEDSEQQEPHEGPLADDVD